MGNEPPEGSKIKVELTSHFSRYVWDNKEMNILGYVITPILFLWLCGWTYVGFSLIQKLMDDPISWSERISRLIGWFLVSYAD